MFSFAGYIFGSLAFIARQFQPSLIGVLVTYPAGVPGVTPPHRHAASAFISVYVVSGSIRSQLGGESAPKVYRAGESWNENPGAHHIVSENARKTAAHPLLCHFRRQHRGGPAADVVDTDPPASAALPTETSSAARSASFF
ncbi:hypothetical protein BV898_19506 [Hypsibius exemplaris]|uniref:Cupin type-2 domain-containing protein n=1 Tax=Hypsibius exemplaris TaxID=2072580 RepID=A0A9X6NJD0_HYPEX|nr:hypothetical protein BV898_19506 [Hypsibius exemplaris]